MKVVQLCEKYMHIYLLRNAVHSSKQQAALTNTPLISQAEHLNKSKLEVL